ncbi:MAG TPA: hypothetical protein VFU05_14495 [Cyclobacteriaceae bacterium]|nr:hypothetical protein [Cyclobacteriaceae bacterium]
MKARPELLVEIKSNQAETGVIRTLLYFDIFHYPLTLEEIIKFHPQKNTRENIVNAISLLRNKLVVFKLDNFYSLHPNPANAQRRKAGNELAKKRLQTARKFSWLISKFPFVRAIMLSGSLSKDYMEASSDIDYFIITEPGRLWITRGLLGLFKRLFLLNSHKFFCTNYLIDSQSLEIEEKNIYTAMETTTLIPVYGKALYEKFVIKNQWTRNHLPNMDTHRNAFIAEKISFLKNIVEKMLSGSAGEKIDLFFMNLAVNRWKKQFGDSFSSKDFELAFKSKRSVSKNHPRFFQKQILNNYQEKIEQFELLNNIKLSA